MKYFYIKDLYQKITGEQSAPNNFSRVYFDGELEYKLQVKYPDKIADLVGWRKGDLTEGIYDCIVHGFECKAYIYEIYNNPSERNIYLGYIVLKSNEGDNKRALAKYTEKPTFI